MFFSADYDSNGKKERSRILQEGRRTQQAYAPNNGASIVTFYDLAVQFSGIQYHKLGNLPKSFSRG